MIKVKKADVGTATEKPTDTENVITAEVTELFEDPQIN